jgi:hypothetical protein
MPWFRAARKEPHWIVKWYGTEVQLDRLRQFRHKRGDDKQQTQGQALRGGSNRVTRAGAVRNRLLRLRQHWRDLIGITDIEQ